MANKIPSVDIVVITWNAVKYLKVCLQSIFQYTKLNYNLIIVNNGSTDQTNKFLDTLKLRSNIQIINNNENLGYPKALEIGYSATRSNYVCLMNDDVYVSPDWIENMLAVMVNNDDVGILGPLRPGAHFIHPYTGQLSKSILEESKNKYKTPRNQIKYFTYNKDYLEFIQDYKSANYHALIKYNSLPNIVSTCCAVVKRRAVEESGGIVDTSFVKYGGDDVDLCWRLMKHNFVLGITSDTYIHHFEHVSMTKNQVDRQKYLTMNANILYNKWKKEISEFIQQKLHEGQSKEDILTNSWLLQRIYASVGENFWSFK